jgi:enamine deaminase RidA (YjgF/YER057c/UK114 family)
MTIKQVRSDSLYKGVPYAYASIVPRGSLIFTAGACPSTTGVRSSASATCAQARLAVANLAATLGESGATLADVLKTTVFIASAQRADLTAAWDVVSAAFRDHDAPSTLLGRHRARLAPPASRDRSRRRGDGGGASSQGEGAAVPVGLDPRVASSAHPDL